MNNTSFPQLTILIVTYDRPREIRQVIDSLRVHIHYPGPITWHIADDSSPGNYIADLLNDYKTLAFHHTITNRQGWGANVNKALQSITTDYIYLNEDDYIVQKDLDLASGVALLESNTDLGIVRYDGIAGHTLNLELREQNTRLGRLNYLRISKHSPHLNVYSNRPHLKHRRLHNTMGLYAEGLSLGQTEEEFAHRVKDKFPNGPHVAILPDGIPRAFDHIGVSRQGSVFDLPF
jgi:glycosyltransferase involved in cell wall biosynthesis